MKSYALLNELQCLKRETFDLEGSENNAPLPIPSSGEGGLKRKAVDDQDSSQTNKAPKMEMNEHDEKSTPSKSPVKPVTPAKQLNTRKPRSATSNEGVSKKPSPVKTDSPRITSFFAKKSEVG